MKQFKRIITRIGLFLLIVVIGAMLCFFLYFQYGGHFLIDNKKTIDFVEKITSSSQLPENFYKAYNLIHPHSLDGGQWSYFYYRDIKKGLNSECPCRCVAYDYSYTKYSIKNLPLATFHLEHYVTQKECLNYMVDKKNIEQYSLKKYGKKLGELNDLEIIKIVLRMEGRDKDSLRAKKILLKML